MSLKDKLARLDKSTPEKQDSQPESEFQSQWMESLERELAAKVLAEKSSFIILKENYYPLYSHREFGDIRENDFVLNKFHQITAEPRAQNFNLRETLFIDLETTGLSGGTGTFAFLIGIGHIELDHIVVRQYVLPDFQHEWLLLKQVENSLLNFTNIISYNGKSFDIPLLRNRFILNRMETVLDELIHVDVLHAARRIWKRRLSACDLQNLEYAILGQERINDIPGEMIPQIYFEYIRKKKALLLRDVLEHNYHDIVNMILLAVKIGHICENPLRADLPGEDLFSIAKYYYQMKNYETALPIFQYLSNQELSEITSKETGFLHSMALKKLSRLQEASAMMHRLLEKYGNHPEAIEELAKYYEHQERNFTAALELVEQGLRYISFLEQLERQAAILDMKDDLIYRKERLLRKLASGKQKAG